MSKDDIIRFLKEIGKTTLAFEPYQYKGLPANTYHWDKYITGDLYDQYETDNTKFVKFEDLKILEEQPKEPVKLLDYMFATCDVDNLLILFFGYTSDDISLDLFATEHVIEPPAYRLLGVFKLDELSREGFIVKINFKESNDGNPDQP